MTTQSIYSEFNERGHRSLSDNNLLQLILSDNKIDYATLPPVSDIASMDKYDLISIGLSEKQAIKILSVFEINKRIVPTIREKITSSQDAFKIAKSKVGNLKYEEFWIILLSRGNTVLNVVKISQGGTIGTVVDTKIILKHAINEGASGIILFHNHPSGNPTPSEADINVTKRTKKLAELMDISVLDHIIVADTNNYYSFGDEEII